MGYDTRYSLATMLHSIELDLHRAMQERLGRERVREEVAVSGSWLSGRALEALSAPWPSSEIAPEERARLYGCELVPRRPSTPLPEVDRALLAALASGPLSAAELCRVHRAAHASISRLRHRGLIERVGGRVRGDGSLRGGRWALRVDASGGL